MIRTPAEQAADEAIEIVEQNADPNWLVVAEQILMNLAREHARFTTDTFWERAGVRGVAFVREPRALGALMRHMAKQGIIEPLEEWEKSVRVTCHARPLRVWRSRVFQARPSVRVVGKPKTSVRPIARKRA